MGSKAQAQSSAAAAKMMKERGIKRRTARCPIGHTHTYAVGNSGLVNHLNVCGGNRRK